MPTAIIERKLMFRHARSVCIPGAALAGLGTEDDGNVHGAEYELTISESLVALAEWARSWTGQLPNDQMADIELRAGVSMEDWRDALDEMASPPARLDGDLVVRARRLKHRAGARPATGQPRVRGMCRDLTF